MKNLATLLRYGADFDKISSACNKKSRLSEEVGIAKLFLQAKRIQIGDTFGMVLPVDNKTITDIGSMSSFWTLFLGIFLFSSDHFHLSIIF